MLGRCCAIKLAKSGVFFNGLHKEHQEVFSFEFSRAFPQRGFSYLPPPPGLYGWFYLFFLFMAIIPDGAVG